jgi:hypothetical protein
MQYLNTFWKTVVSKIPYLNLKRRQQEPEERRPLEEVLQERRQLEQELEERTLKLEQLLEERKHLVEEAPQERRYLERMIEIEEWVLEQRRWLLEERLVESDRSPNPRTPKSSVEVRQKSHIKGWLSKILLEEWCGELEALRYSWLNEGKPEVWIKIMTAFHLLGLLKAYLQIKVENKWLPKKKQS